jgi:hypothetical protein
MVLATTSLPVPGSLHGRRFGDQRRRSFGAQEFVLRLQPEAPAERVAQLDLGAHNTDQTLVFPGLLDEVAGSPAHGLNSQIDTAPGGHHHHGQDAVHGLNSGEEIETLLAAGGVAAIVEVHDDAIEIAGVNGREYGCG